MPNPNYVRGRRKEQQVVLDAKALGKIAFRSSASRGPIDVVTIDLSNNTIELIQCKAGYFSYMDKFKLEQEWSKLNGTFTVRYKVR